MIERGERTRLLVKPGQVVASGGALRYRHLFQRNVDVAVAIVAAIHDPHATLAEDAAHLIALGDAVSDHDAIDRRRSPRRFARV